MHNLLTSDLKSSIYWERLCTVGQFMVLVLVSSGDLFASGRRSSGNLNGKLAYFGGWNPGTTVSVEVRRESPQASHCGKHLLSERFHQHLIVDSCLWECLFMNEQRNEGGESLVIHTSFAIHSNTQTFP